tara:strand:+ start:289 stop:1365 length:1077 start_codon:yes stop_codon:yes gene_type:complete
MFELTKRKLGANTFPIVRTSDMSDLSVVDQYADKSTHVWLVYDSNDVSDTFNWKWRPPREQFHNIHSFPRCNKQNNRPINWTSVLLVPTDVSRRGDIVRQNIISSYGKSSTYPIYFYSITKTSPDMKFRRYQKQYSSVHLIKNKNNLDEVLGEINETESHYFLVDISMNLTDDILTQVDAILNNNEMMLFPSTRRSTDHEIYNFSAMLVPNNTISLNKLLDCDVVHYSGESIGEINDIITPEKSWTSAYQLTYVLHQNIFTKNNKLKNKIISDLISKNQTENSRLYKYVYDGSVSATMDLQDDNDITLSNCLDFDYMREKFVKRQSDRVVLTENQKSIRSKMIRKIYGISDISDRKII